MISCRTIPPEKVRQLLPENGDVLINLPEEVNEWKKGPFKAILQMDCMSCCSL